MIWLSDNNYIFPDPLKSRNKDGIIALGGDLSFERLLNAYKNGIFPWFSEGDPIIWWSPDPRFVLFPQKINISRSMRKFLKKELYTISTNKNFEAVIDNCQNIRESTWITEDMKKAYIDLHKKGYAHSFEVWKDDELVGGLYGVKLGNYFCGESMFSKMENASKTALIYLCQNYDFEMIDCQVYTNYLSSMGAEFISRKDFIEIIKRNI